MPSDYLARVAALGCAICGQPAQVHHAKGGSLSGLSGMGMRSPDAYAIPLCERHHTGDQGLHKLGVRTWEALHGPQSEIVEAVQRKLGQQAVRTTKVLPR